MVERLRECSSQQLKAFAAELRAIGVLEAAHAACRKHDATLSEVRGRSNFKHVYIARRECMRLVAEARPSWSQRKIGAVFGRNNSSVMTALEGGRVVADERRRVAKGAEGR